MACKFRKLIAEKVCLSLARHGLTPASVNPCDLAPLIKISSSQRQFPQLILPVQSISEAVRKSDVLVKKDLLVEDLRKSLPRDNSVIEDVIELPTKSSCIAFNINKTTFVKDVLDSLKGPDVFQNFRRTSCVLTCIKPQKIVVEYSSPNIAKVFHVGHLRSTILGHFAANLCTFVGHQVVRINYLGDWGTQYGLLSAGYKRFGSEESLKRNAILHLLEVYVKANKLAEMDESIKKEARMHFQKLEEGDLETTTQWEHFRTLSIDEYKKVYKRLGIEFDFYHGESMYSSGALTVIEYLQGQGLARLTEDGAIVCNIAAGGAAEHNVTIGKSDGSTLYISRDIAAAIDRKNRYEFDKALYVVGNSQTDHFTAVKAILKSLGYDWSDAIQHVKFGLIRGMSTRKGQMVTLEDLLNEAQSLAYEGMKRSPNCTVTEGWEDIADILGVSAVLINCMHYQRCRDYDFDWEKTLQFSGDSGISLQYFHARLVQLERNCGFSLNVDCDTSKLVEPEAVELVIVLATLDQVLHQCYEELEPCVLVKYLFKLRHAIGKVYKKLQVKNQEPGIAEARLLLYHTSRRVLSEGMKILGLTPLDRM